MNNPSVTLSNDQWHALNRTVAVAQVACKELGWTHHDVAIRDAQEVLSKAVVDRFSFDLADCLRGAGLPVPAKLQ